jgi:hypothetical protein
MRLYRLLAIGLVLLLAGGVLGTACTGATGEQGPEGDPGTDGVGIENIVNNGDGTFTVNLSNGESYTTDNLTGPQGPQGIQGEEGPQGPPGEPGLPGAGVTWKGEWSESTTYSLNDAVGYQGSSYISRLDGNTGIPPTDADAWDLWVDKGDTGEQGPQGEQGVPGPNLIVAMGNISADGTINQAYNVDNVSMPEEEGANPYYAITLTGIYYDQSAYVTMVTCTDAGYSHLTATYSSGGGQLVIEILSDAGTVVVSDFSFMVLQCP